MIHFVSKARFDERQKDTNTGSSASLIFPASPSQRPFIPKIYSSNFSQKMSNFLETLSQKVTDERKGEMNNSLKWSALLISATIREPPATPQMKFMVKEAIRCYMGDSILMCTKSGKGVLGTVHSCEVKNQTFLTVLPSTCKGLSLEEKKWTLEPVSDDSSYIVWKSAMEKFQNESDCMSTSLKELLINEKNCEDYAKSKPETLGYIIPPVKELKNLLKDLNCSFNESQMEALNDCVTRSFTLIQGYDV